MAPQTWLITGCSSYFGAEFVRQLRALGDNVIATGRNAETKLAHLKESGVSILELDVTAPEDVIAAKVEEAWGIYPGGIDIVVNNAGYILSAAFEELTQKDLEDVFKTNFHGPLNITRAILPKAANQGNRYPILHGLSSWVAELWSVLQRKLAIFAPGIKVLLVEPGYFRTNAFSNINHVAPRVDVYAEFNAGAQAFEKSVVGNEPGDSTKAIAPMIELTKGTGMAAGKTIPLRVPIGTDGWTRIKAKCEETLKICDAWEELAKSTDVQQA